MASAIAIQTKAREPLTIPMSRVHLVKPCKTSGNALVELVSGETVETLDPYQKLSDRMTSTQVWGTVGTEPA